MTSCHYVLSSKLEKFTSNTPEEQLCIDTYDFSVTFSLSSTHFKLHPQLASGVTVESISNNIQILSDAFEKNDTSCEKTDSVVGILTGQSKGLKRPTFYKGESTSGMKPFRTCMNSFILIL